MESCLLRPPLCPPRVSSWKGASAGRSPARMRGWSRAEAQGVQEKAGAEPKRQPTRLGLGNKRERAGRGKGRPRKAKRGSYSRAGAGEGRDAAGSAGAREGERDPSLGRPRPRMPKGRGEAQARPGPARPRQSTPGERRDERRAGPGEAARGQVGPAGRNAMPRPLPVMSRDSPPRSWGAPGIRSRQFRSSLADRSA